MDLKERFDSAVTRSRSLPNQPNETLLELYALYKQATAGDASGERPGVFDMVGRAKHDAWSAKAGMSSEDAMTAYAQLVERLGS